MDDKNFDAVELPRATLHYLFPNATDLVLFWEGLIEKIKLLGGRGRKNNSYF